MANNNKCLCCDRNLNNGNVEYKEAYKEYCYDCGEELYVMTQQLKEEGV